MSFYNHISKYIGYVPEEGDNEFFLRQMTDSLNEWFMELTTKWSIPTFTATGTITTPSGATTPGTFPYYLISKGSTFDFDSVKNALWCGTPEISFINLFEVVGTKLMDNFTVAQSYVVAGIANVTLIPTSFQIWGTKFAMDCKQNDMDAEKFMNLLSDYFDGAIRDVTAPGIIAAGACPGGVFNGTIMLKLNP